MKVRLIDEIVEDIRGELTRLRSEMASFLRYSNLHILFRAIASVISELEVKLQNIENESYIRTATKDYLDRRGKDYGVFRLNGTKAVGSVLVKGPRINLPKGIILDTPNQSIQYETTQSITTFEEIEMPISIISLSRSSLANLPSGTRLYTPLFPLHSFTIGKYRDGLGIPQGGLVGGSEVETDDSYRDNILRNIKGPNTGTIASILSSLRSLPFIEKVYIEEHSPVSGYFTVVTDITDMENINQMKELINQVKPIGVSYMIRTLSSQLVDINLKLKITSLTLTSSIDTKLKTDLRSLNSSFKPNQSLTRETISGIVLQVPGVVGLDIVSPLQDISPSSGNLLQVDKVDISFYT